MKKRDIIIGVVAFLFVSGAFIYGLSTNEPDRSDWVLSAGRIYTMSEVRSKWRGVEHWVDGKRYDGIAGIGLDGNIVGDVYQILVNPNDYEHIFLLEERPIFLKEEKTGETVGWIEEDYILKFDKWYKGAYTKFMAYGNGYKKTYLEYFYTVGNKKYNRVQKIVIPIKKSIVFQKGMRFKVRYWLEDPQCSILDYDEKR